MVFGGLFLKSWMVPFFSVGSVQLVTCIQLLSGHGTGTVPVPYGNVGVHRTVRYGSVRYGTDQYRSDNARREAPRNKAL